VRYEQCQHEKPENLFLGTRLARFFGNPIFVFLHGMRIGCTHGFSLREWCNRDTVKANDGAQTNAGLGIDGISHLKNLDAIYKGSEGTAIYHNLNVVRLRVIIS